MEESNFSQSARVGQMGNIFSLVQGKKIKPNTGVDKNEETLLNIAIAEYKDLFSKIMILPQNKFMPTLERFIQIALAPKNLLLQSGTMSKILNIIKTKYYDPDCLRVNKKVQSIGDIRKCEKFTSSNFIPHCNLSSEPIHSCGSTFYYLSPYLLCLKCKMIYNPNCVLFHCKACDVDYYSSIQTGNDNQVFKPATWQKYHCNVVINDTMKCLNCKGVLYLNIKNKLLYCHECNTEFDPYSIKWICMICGKEFKSEPKIYNPLEYKIMKMTVKQTLFDGIEAKPECVPCCKIPKNEIKNYTFYHKKDCGGIMYEGYLNHNKIVVCSKCNMLYHFEKHHWLCPICRHRFKLTGENKKNPSNYINTSASERGSNNNFREQRTMTEGRNYKDYRSDSKGFKHCHTMQGKQKYTNEFYDEENTVSKSTQVSKKSTISEASKNDISKGLKDLSINERPKKQPLKYDIIENFSNEDYTIINQIGQGTFGKIFEVEDSNHNKYAMKKILTNSKEEIHALENEYEMLRSLSKYNLSLVNIYGMESRQLDKTTYSMYVLMDLALRDWEKEIELRGVRKQYYAEQELIVILKELTYTFAELQRHNISHRDIKPQNILLFQDKSFKISDFGEAKRVIQRDKTAAKQTIRGTELYMSPILFHALKSKGIAVKYTKHNTYKSDVFSLGLCFLLAATLTFNSLIGIRELEDMISIKLVLGKYLKGKYSNKFIDILYSMIELDENLRYDFIDLEKYVENL